MDVAKPIAIWWELLFQHAVIMGAVPLSRETGSSPWEEGRDTKGVLRDSRYDL